MAKIRGPRPGKAKKGQNGPFWPKWPFWPYQLEKSGGFGALWAPNAKMAKNGHFGLFHAKPRFWALFQGWPKRHAETTGNGQKGVKIGAKMTHFGPYLGPLLGPLLGGSFGLNRTK